MVGPGGELLPKIAAFGETNYRRRKERRKKNNVKVHVHHVIMWQQVHEPMYYMYRLYYD